MMDDWSDVPAVPVYPNWASPYTERHEFRTTVFEADTGDEQRRSMRQRPRRSLQYIATPHGEAMRQLSAMLTLRRDTKIKVPDITRSVPGVAVTDTRIELPEGLPSWLGAQVFVQQGRNAEMATVVETDGSALLLAGALQFEYTNPRVSPARFCRFQQTQKFSMPTSTTASVNLRLDIDPGTEEDAAGVNPPLQFRGQNTQFIKPNWRDGVGVTFGVPGDRVDYSVGQITVDYRQVLNTKVMEFTFLGRDRAEVQQHVDLFHSCKGRRGVFYIPTWTSDFEMVNVDYENNEIVVRGAYRNTLDPFDFSHRNIALISGGTVIPCGVYSARAVPAGLALKMDRVLTTLPIPDHFFISWLVMARFASDELAIDWRTDTIAEISYNVAVMRDGFREFAIGGHRIVFNGDYVLMGE